MMRCSFTWILPLGLAAPALLLAAMMLGHGGAGQALPVAGAVLFFVCCLRRMDMDIPALMLFSLAGLLAFQPWQAGILPPPSAQVSPPLLAMLRGTGIGAAHLSFLAYLAFLSFGMLALRRYVHWRLLYYASLAFFLFWPRGVLSAYEGGAVMVSHAFFMAGFYYFTRWYQEKNIEALRCCLIVIAVGMTASATLAVFLAAMLALMLWELLHRRLPRRVLLTARWGGVYLLIAVAIFIDYRFLHAHGLQGLESPPLDSFAPPYSLLAARSLLNWLLLALGLYGLIAALLVDRKTLRGIFPPLFISAVMLAASLALAIPFSLVLMGCIIYARLLEWHAVKGRWLVYSVGVMLGLVFSAASLFFLFAQQGQRLPPPQ